MASKHAGLIFLLWLKHLVRIIDWSKEEKVDRPPLSLRSKSTLSVLLRPCSKTIHLAFLQFLFFFASFHVGQETRIVMQLFAYVLSSFLMLVAKSQPAFPPGISDIMRQLAACVCVNIVVYN